MLLKKISITFKSNRENSIARCLNGFLSLLPGKDHKEVPMLRRLFSGLVLLLVACSAFAADTGTSSGIEHFVSHLSPPETDYSLCYLGQVFGTVGNVVRGTKIGR